MVGCAPARIWFPAESGDWPSGALHEAVEHALIPGGVKMHVQLVVLGRLDGAVAELLVEHPGADRERVGPGRPCRLFPGFDDAGPTGVERKLRRKGRGSSDSPVAGHAGGIALLDVFLWNFLQEP